MNDAKKQDAALDLLNRIPEKYITPEKRIEFKTAIETKHRSVEQERELKQILDQWITNNFHRNRHPLP